MKARPYLKPMYAVEKKALEKEVKKELAEYDRKHFTELDAIILWSLHSTFGFGPERLKRFYENFTDEMQALLDRYDMDDTDILWLCTYKLKEYGVDIEQWRQKKKLK